MLIILLFCIREGKLHLTMANGDAQFAKQMTKRTEPRRLLFNDYNFTKLS